MMWDGLTLGSVGATILYYRVLTQTNGRNQALIKCAQAPACYKEPGYKYGSAT